MLQIIDDIIFMYQANTKNIVTIKDILKYFELILGLKVNLHKSMVGEIRIDAITLHRYATILNCSIIKFSFTCIGVPISESHTRAIFGRTC